MIPVPTPAPDRHSLADLLGTVGGKYGKPSAQTAGVTDLFDEEVERAIERQGGAAAMDAREGAQTNTRRSGRHGAFDRARTEADAARSDTRRAGEDDGRDADQILIESPAQEQPRTAHNGQAREEAANERAETRDLPAEGRTKAKAQESRGTNEAASKHGLPAAAPGSNGAGSANASSVQSNAGKIAITGMRAVAPTGASSANSDGAGAFLNSARGGNNGGGFDRAESAAPATPDNKLIEHAAEVLKQIRMSLKGGSNEITLQLSPAHLGRLAIKMRMRDGKLATVVRVESQATLEMLEKQAPELRAVLAQQGVETESLEFELGFDRKGAQQDARDGQGSRPNTTRGAIRATSHSNPTAAADPLQPDTRTTHINEDGVDTFA